MREEEYNFCSEGVGSVVIENSWNARETWAQ